MEDLLQSQIQDSCRLALPEGIRSLMCDISREVLRSQPVDLYKFIVDYLSALLLVRDTLPIACRVYRDICECSCQPEIEEELTKIGLEGEDLVTAKNVVMEYFDKGEVKEGNLLMKLFHKSSIDEALLPSIQGAVRAAFLKHQLMHQNKLKDNDNAKGKTAANHTLNFYEKKYDGNEITNDAATKIQACFRGYLVRRKLDYLVRRKLDKAYYKLKGNFKKATDEAMKQDYLTAMSKPGPSNLGRLSSYSLAGSFLSLPQYVPYSAHGITYTTTFEGPEKEPKHVDYALKTNLREQKSDGERKIMFQEVYSINQIDSCSVVEETECCIEEDIVEDDVQSEVTSVDENINEENSYNYYREKKHQLETMVDEILEEKQLFSTIYGEHKEHIEMVVDEMSEENQLILPANKEKKHDVEILFNERIEENRPPNEFGFNQETVDEQNESNVVDNKIRNENSKGDIYVEERREIETAAHDMANDQQQLVEGISDGKIIEEEYNVEPDDDELNELESVDEQLIILSNYDIIEPDSNHNLSVNKQRVSNIKIVKPSDHKITKINERVKYSDSSIIEQNESNKWQLKPSSYKIKDQENINVLKRLSGILKIPVAKDTGMKDKYSSAKILHPVNEITEQNDPNKNLLISLSKDFNPPGKM